MMFNRQRVVRVSYVAGPGGERIESPTWSRNFYLVVDEADAEFADAAGTAEVRKALIRMYVRGERFRVLKSGTKSTGRAGLEFSGGNLPGALLGLAWQMYDATVFDDAMVAQRHTERMAQVTT